MFALAIVGAVALIACRDPGLVSANGDLRVDRTTVEFGEASLGVVGQQSVLLTNTGGAAATMRLESTPPFGSPTELSLAGGESRSVELTFSPSALGPATGTINVTTPNSRLTLVLFGNGVEPPSCASTLCKNATLDSRTSLCVVSPQPDGTACTDGCVVGSCENSKCVGTAVTCDDGDPCTVDSCTPGDGCAHVPK